MEYFGFYVFFGITFAAVALILLGAICRFGSFEQLFRPQPLRFHWPLLAAITPLLAYGVYSRNQWVSTVNLAIYAAGGLLLVVLFMLFRPALPLFCFIGGIASNYAAIAANGMRMPVLSAGGVGRYVPITATTKLWWLGDVIPLASSNGHATAMMSIGDLVLTISLALFAVRIWLSPTPEREYDSD